MISLLNRALFAAFLLIIIFPNILVNAHSNLVKTYPNGSVELEQSPQTVEAWFQDPVQIHSNSFIIKNSSGKVFETEMPYIDPENRGHLIASLKSPLPAGNYVVEINTIALDGYVSKETYRFKVIKKEIEQKETDDIEVKLVRASPSDGEIIKGSVKRLDLWYNQPVKVSAIGVFDDQIRALSKEVSIDEKDPNHVIVSFDNEITTGTHQVSWFVQPVEGNALTERMGVFYFTVNEFSAISTPLGTPIVNWLANINIKQLAYWIMFVGFSTLFGVAWFNHFINNNVQITRWKKLSLLFVVLSVIGEILYLTILRRELFDLPLTEFLVLKFSWVALLQMALIFVGLISHRLNVYLYGISLILFSLVAGHSSYPRYGGALAMGVNSIHLIAIAIWIGGLIALMTMAPKENRIDWLKINAKRFSKWALGSVVLITFSGIWMTVNFVPSFSFKSFIQSIWGRTVAIKVIIFLFMLFIALSQQRLVRNFSSKILNVFRVRLHTELLYGLFALFLAGILVVSTPSAAEQGIYPKQLTKNGIQVEVDIAPLYPGHNVITLQFDENSNVKEAIVRLFMPPEWEKINKAFKIDDQTFKLTGMNLHAAGTAYMEVKAKTAHGDTIVFPFRIVIPGEIRFNE